MKIAICGPICSGKTYLSDYLSKQYNLEKYSFGDKVKDIAIDIFTMHYKDRPLLQSISDKMKEIDKEIKYFLKKNMYNHKTVITNTNKGKKIIRNLFHLLRKNPKRYINKDIFKNENKERVIADFIAGMTDRFAINLYKKIK